MTATTVPVDNLPAEGAIPVLIVTLLILWWRWGSDSKGSN